MMGFRVDEKRDEGLCAGHLLNPDFVYKGLSRNRAT